MKADELVTSPPWGGPDFIKKRTFPLTDLCGSNGGGDIMRIAKSIASRVILHLPKNSDKYEACTQPRRNTNISTNYLARTARREFRKSQTPRLLLGR